MSDSDRAHQSSTHHPRRRLPNPNDTSNRPQVPHSSSFHSASQFSSQPTTPPRYHDDFFQEAFADLTPPTAARLSHFNTILNPPVIGTEVFTSPPARSSPPQAFSPGPRPPSVFDPSAVSAFPHPAMSNPRLPNGYVDLTHDQFSPPSPPSNPLRRTSKRTTNIESSPGAGEGPSTKRLRRNDGTSLPISGIIDSPIEEIDLVDGDKALLQSALRKQRLEQAKVQEHPAEKPLKLSNLTCVICMDTPTDITATSCGTLLLRYMY
jgi:hypothetical protein